MDESGEFFTQCTGKIQSDKNRKFKFKDTLSDPPIKKKTFLKIHKKTLHIYPSQFYSSVWVKAESFLHNVRVKLNRIKTKSLNSLVYCLSAFTPLTFFGELSGGGEGGVKVNFFLPKKISVFYQIKFCKLESVLFKVLVKLN